MNKKDSDKKTALHLALDNGSAEIFERLLEYIDDKGLRFSAL